MPASNAHDAVRIAIIGAGPSATIITCRPSGSIRGPRSSAPATPTRSCSKSAKTDWGIDKVSTDPEAICADPDVNAVIIATPNFTHHPIALAAAQRQARDVRKAARAECDRSPPHVPRRAQAQVVHMTAFTYRFAPAMRYLKHLMTAGSLGEPRHFRGQRFLDSPETSWGWRQYEKMAGGGDLFDMTIHRIDFAIDLLGPITPASAARGTLRTAYSNGHRRVVRTVGRQRLVEHAGRVHQSAPPACGKEPRWPKAIIAKASATSGPRSMARKARPFINCTRPTASCSVAPGTISRRSTSPPSFSSRPAVPRSGRRPTGHGVSLRSGVGIRVGDRQAPPGRTQLFRRPKGPDRG